MYIKNTLQLHISDLRTSSANNALPSWSSMAIFFFIVILVLTSLLTQPWIYLIVFKVTLLLIIKENHVLNHYEDMYTVFSIVFEKQVCVKNKSSQDTNSLKIFLLDLISLNYLWLANLRWFTAIYFTEIHYIV